MNKTLQYKKFLIIGTVLSLLLFILFFLTETPILSALILFLATISMLMGILLILDIFNNSKKIQRNIIVSSTSSSIICLPILGLLLFFSFHFAQTTRIDIINNTDQTIDNWEISGCESLWRDNHYPKQTETIWLDLTGDCSLEIEYTQQGLTRKEIIIGNVKPALFSKVEFYIQPNNSNQ